MLFAAITINPRNKYIERFRDANIYIQAKARAGGTFTVTARLAKDILNDTDSCGFVGPFRLGSYELASVSNGFGQYLTAKKVPRYPQDNVGQAKKWVRTCLADHDRCRTFQEETVDSRQRPSRVLEITETSARLRCVMQNTEFEYLVLSHMWGDQHEEQIQLLESNLDKFQVNVPWDELCASAIYKEAIRITWTLGYRYLWIDSLCIIQDSDPDWQYEAGRMAIVYGNAVCNISTLFPAQSDTVTTQRTDPRDWSPCILREATPFRPGLYIERPRPANDLPPWLIQSEWPLFKRAWTFQEYLLSPRNLLVGHTNLMFQCSELFYDELLGPQGDGNGMLVNEEKSTKVTGIDFGKTRYFPSALTRVASAASLTDVPVLLFIEDWLKVFNEYRARNLTYASDRVIAFAGIARAFSHLGSLTYLAGAWKECLPLCLLWYLDKKPTNIAMQDNNLPDASNLTYTPIIHEDVHDPTTTIPSWSWFSAPVYKYHNIHFLLCSDELSLRRKANLTPSTVNFENIFFATCTSYCFPKTPADTLPPHPQSSFSDFKKLEVTLSTRTLPIKFNLPRDLSAQLARIRHLTTHPEDSHFDCDPVFTYHHDNLLHPRRNPPRNALLALMAEIQIVRVAGKYGVQRILAGLVLVRSEEEEGTWKRVGVWKLKVKIWGVGVEEGSVRGVAERWRGYEIVGGSWGRGDVIVV
ncbi:hypothetical protein NX059_010779 [Plenodomus lindquistii]|nr:hypothetical protein NX059_010779 [Plenodomus lindquistii]